MKRRFKLLALVLVLGGVVGTSCTKEEPISDKKEVLSFIFEASKYVELDQIIIAAISGNTITADVPFGTIATGLIPTIEISPKAIMNPDQGMTMDFSSPVTFTVTAEDGSTKVFESNVAIAPAPYIGSWSSKAIDFGLGLMYVKVNITDDGDFQMELQELLSGNINNESIKGEFNPQEKPGTEVLLNQTHKWGANQWSDQTDSRTIMYVFDEDNSMRFYYCYCHPKVQWVFEVELHQE